MLNLLERLAKQVAGGASSRSGDSVLSRRSLLLAGFSSLAAMRPSATQAVPQPSANRFLVNRLTFGWTEEEQLLADTLGYHGYLEHHLNPEAIPDNACESLISSYLRLNWNPYNLHSVQPQVTVHQVTESTIVRAVYSKRQLLERMVEFWTDHFNVDINKSHIPWLFPLWLRLAIRPHALGTFPQLLAATAQSQVMMFYLDNVISNGTSPNENYSRELMELHTMDVGGGYTQEDVEEVARCFTGWTVHYGYGSGSTWEFLYRPEWHDNGPKVVLGTQIPAGGGFNDGLTVLDILAHHPSTARFISRKLCQRFWDYNPSETLVDAVTTTYMNTGGDIKAMLRTLFTTVNPSTAAPKFKRPFHLFASTMRATKTQINPQPFFTGSALRNLYSSAGHHPFYHSPPDGYPDRLDAWSGLLLPRWNFSAILANNGIADTSINLAAFLDGASTSAAVADRIDQRLFGGRMPASEKALLLNYLGAGSPTESVIRDAIGLAASAPSYQWY